MMIGEWDSKGTSPRGAETIQCIVSEFPGLAAALPQCRRESHYPLQQKYPPEWGDIFVEMMIGEWDSKGTSPRGAETIQCIVSEFPGLAAALPQCRRESHYPLQKEQAVTRWLILFAGPFAPSPRPLPMI